MAEQYSHRPLNNLRQIRLLKILHKPSPFNPENWIECELVKASLDNYPPYFAVSYSWQSQIPTRFILCEGKQLFLTANCAAALLYFSDQKLETYFWVDSLCIDQSSISERNHQVTLMGEIYAKATHAVVWLGDGTEDSDLAMKELHNLSQLAKVSPKLVEWRYRKLQKSRYLKYSAAFHTSGFPRTILFPETLTGFHDPTDAITTRSWFHRIWTLQEIVLARKAVVLCGERSIAWEDLTSVANVVTQGDASSGFTQYPGDEFQRLRVVNMLRSKLGISEGYEQISYQLSKSHPLGSIKMTVSQMKESRDLGIATHIFLASCLQCSDPRDKIYGLYAILQQYGIELPLPDYEKPLSTIYRETSRALIQYDSSLELLYYVSARRTIPDLPSWVPDTMNDWFAWIPGFEFTTASKDSAARFTFNSAGNLGIHGVHIDTIQHTSDELAIWDAHGLQDLHNDQAFFAKFRTVLKHFRNWVEFALNRSYVTDDPLGAFLMVTLQEIGLAFRANPRKWRKLRKYFLAWTATLKTSSTSLAATQDAIEKTLANITINEITPSPPDEKEQEPTQQSYAEEKRVFKAIASSRTSTTIHQIVSQRGNGNRLFATTAGRLGIAATDIRDGDLVVLVAGMRLPMILREEKEACRIISASWVHGAMHGELWSDDASGLKEFGIV